MQTYRSRYGKLPGSSYDEVMPKARKEFNFIRRLTRRQPYIRSVYFKKDKIFISLFWEHLAQKHRGDRTQRLKFYKCAIDLLRNTTIEPETVFSGSDMKIILHRFRGETSDGEKFIVQVKQNKRSGRKDFMSVFPEKNRNK